MNRAVGLRAYSRLAVRAGVKSFEDATKKGTKKKLIIGDESIPDDVIPPRPKAAWFISLKQVKIGEPLASINIFKEGKDPILQPDETYPTWIWSALDKPRPKQYLEDWEITTRKQLRTMNHFRMQMSNNNKTKPGKKDSNPFK